MRVTFKEKRHHGRYRDFGSGRPVVIDARGFWLELDLKPNHDSIGRPPANGSLFGFGAGAYAVRNLHLGLWKPLLWSRGLVDAIRARAIRAIAADDDFAIQWPFGPASLRNNRSRTVDRGRVCCLGYDEKE